MASALRFEVGPDARPAGDYWSISFSGAHSCSVIANNIVLGSGEVVALDIVAPLGLLSGAEGQNASVKVGFRAHLVEAVAPQQEGKQSCSMTFPKRDPDPRPTAQPLPTPEPSSPPEPNPSPSPSPSSGATPSPSQSPASPSEPTGSVTPSPEPSAPTPGGSAADSEDGGASLPISGASIRLALFMAAILIGAGGMFLVIVRRKKNDDD